MIDAHSQVADSVGGEQVLSIMGAAGISGALLSALGGGRKTREIVPAARHHPDRITPAIRLKFEPFREGDPERLEHIRRMGTLPAFGARSEARRAARAAGDGVPGRAIVRGLDATSTMMEPTSIMTDSTVGLNRRIAERVRELRGARGLSLDALAGRSGVSRSMISLIERGESSPTAVVLEKLAAGLGVMLASLFDAPATAEPAPRGPLARRDDQPLWRDPASGYLRRNVSPPGVPQPMQIVEVRFPPGARVAFETGARDVPAHQQVWVLEGAIDVTLGAERHRLRVGDCLAMRLDRPTMFHNPTRKPTRYAVVIASGPAAR